MRQRPKEHDKTPEKFVGREVKGNPQFSRVRGKSFVVLGRPTSACRLWARIYTVNDRLVMGAYVQGADSPAGVLTRSYAAEQMKDSNGFLCALKEVQE